MMRRERGVVGVDRGSDFRGRLPFSLPWLGLMAVVWALTACTPCVERSVCLQCGPADECLRPAHLCAPLCRSTADCRGGDTCFNGACQPIPCG